MRNPIKSFPPDLIFILLYFRKRAFGHPVEAAALLLSSLKLPQGFFLRQFQRVQRAAASMAGKKHPAEKSLPLATLTF